MQVCRSFSPSTGLGWDNFHMGLVRFMDGSFVQRLHETLTSWERNPHCERMWVAIHVFLPKPDGGTRPIGLLCF
eukprot:6955258-Pyramimonas_sp.AAC.1